MAKSTGDGGGGTEATTLVFPKKSAWEEAVEAKRVAKKRSQSANATFGQTLTRLVDDEHMDRRAARIVLAVHAIEDDGDLHVTVHHILDGFKKLGILKRAMAQEEMFGEHKIPADLADGAAKATRRKPPAKADAPDNVTPIGDASRKVAERAGEQTAG